MQNTTVSRLKRRAKKALAAATVGGTAALSAACSTVPATQTAHLETGFRSQAAPVSTRHVQPEYNEQRQIAMELGYSLDATYVGYDGQRVVLRRVDRSTGQIRWGFNNYGHFTDEGTYRVIGSREGCWMTYRATFLDLETRREFSGKVAKPHLMDEWNCRRIGATYGPIRDGIQSLRDGIRRATPGPAYDDRSYGGYGSRGIPEPYTGGGYYYPRRGYGW